MVEIGRRRSLVGKGFRLSYVVAIEVRLMGTQRRRHQLLYLKARSAAMTPSSAKVSYAFGLTYPPSHR